MEVEVEIQCTFSLAGTQPVSKDKLNIWDNGNEILEATALKTLVFIPSMSRLVLDSRDRIASLIISGWTFSNLNSSDVNSGIKLSAESEVTGIFSLIWFAIEEKKLLKLFAISEASLTVDPSILTSLISEDLVVLQPIDSFKSFHVAFGSFWFSASLFS